MAERLSPPLDGDDLSCHIVWMNQANRLYQVENLIRTAYGLANPELTMETVEAIAVVVTVETLCYGEAAIQLHFNCEDFIGFTAAGHDFDAALERALRAAEVLVEESVAVVAETRSRRHLKLVEA